jgi:ABC-type multidrug transport system ATPase subunit
MTRSNNVIETRDLTKIYRNQVRAVDRLNLTV